MHYRVSTQIHVHQCLSAILISKWGKTNLSHWDIFALTTYVYCHEINMCAYFPDIRYQRLHDKLVGLGRSIHMYITFNNSYSISFNNIVFLHLALLMKEKMIIGSWVQKKRHNDLNLDVGCRNMQMLIDETVSFRSLVRLEVTA